MPFSYSDIKDVLSFLNIFGLVTATSFDFLGQKIWAIFLFVVSISKYPVTFISWKSNEKEL